jgi:hypothetical protein
MAADEAVVGGGRFGTDGTEVRPWAPRLTRLVLSVDGRKPSDAGHRPVRTASPLFTFCSESTALAVTSGS